MRWSTHQYVLLGALMEPRLQIKELRVPVVAPPPFTGLLELSAYSWEHTDWLLWAAQRFASLWGPVQDQSSHPNGTGPDFLIMAGFLPCF